MEDPLLPRIANGDSSAIDECIERYGALVWSLARRLSPSMADAEDAVQEIFVDLWKNAGRFRDEVAREATFVALLARRRLIDRLRKSRRELESQPIDETALQYAAPPQTPPAELAEEGLRATACLERLRSDERKVLELSIYHGLPQTRIAEQTGLPLGTVKTHARRGLSQLRDCMQVRRQRRPKGVEVA
ncbi:MAG: sigma-70 family RNA polymerase sigma factor [Pirellulales bacterium]